MQLGGQKHKPGPVRGTCAVAFSSLFLPHAFLRRHPLASSERHGGAWFGWLRVCFFSSWRGVGVFWGVSRRPGERRPRSVAPWVGPEGMPGGLRRRGADERAHPIVRASADAAERERRHHRQGQAHAGGHPVLAADDAPLEPEVVVQARVHALQGAAPCVLPAAMRSRRAASAGGMRRLPCADGCAGTARSRTRGIPASRRHCARPAHCGPQATAGHRRFSAARLPSRPWNAMGRIPPVAGHRQKTRPFPLWGTLSTRPGWTGRSFGRPGCAGGASQSPRPRLPRVQQRADAARIPQPRLQLLLIAAPVGAGEAAAVGGNGLLGEQRRQVPRRAPSARRPKPAPRRTPPAARAWRRPPSAACGRTSWRRAPRACRCAGPRPRWACTPRSASGSEARRPRP